MKVAANTPSRSHSPTEKRSLRADFSSEDLSILLMANADVIAATSDDAPDT